MAQEEYPVFHNQFIYPFTYWLISGYHWCWRLASVSPAVEPKKNRRRIYAIILVVVLLAVVLGYLAFEVFYLGSGPVYIEVVPDKPFYMQGEEIRLSIYINNQRDRPVPYPESVVLYIRDLDYYMYSAPGAPPGLSSIPPHHKTIYYVHIWDQKVEVDGNRTQVPPSNYTITVSFEGQFNFGEGTNCTIEIRPNPAS